MILVPCSIHLDDLNRCTLLGDETKIAFRSRELIDSLTRSTIPFGVRTRFGYSESKRDFIFRSPSPR
jgi:hypothetical protein